MAHLFIQGLIFLFIFPSPAAATTWKGNELLSQFRLAPWKLGPFRIQPSIILSDFGYDSNIYCVNNPIKDYTFTAGPAFNVYLAVKKKVVLTVSESPRYVYFFETARERTWNNYLRGDVSFLFNKFFISFSANLTNARERWNYEIDIRPRRKEQGFQGFFLWQPTKKTSLSLSTRKSRYDYENLEFIGFRIGDQLNRDEIYINAGAYYQLTNRTRAFLDFEYGKFEFQNPLNPRDSESRAAYGGFEFSPLGKIRGRVRLGYKYFRALKEGMSDYKGLVGDTSISLSPLRVLSLRGSYRRNVQFSIWTDSNYYVENSAGAGLSCYIFSKKIRLDYDFNYIDDIYPQPEQNRVVPGIYAQSGRDDIFWMNSVGIYFRLRKNIGLGLKIGQWYREAHIFHYRANRNYIGLNITYDF